MTTTSGSRRAESVVDGRNSRYVRLSPSTVTERDSVVPVGVTAGVGLAPAATGPGPAHAARRNTVEISRASAECVLLHARPMVVVRWQNGPPAIPPDGWTARYLCCVL